MSRALIRRPDFAVDTPTRRPLTPAKPRPSPHRHDDEMSFGTALIVMAVVGALAYVLTPLIEVTKARMSTEIASVASDLRLVPAQPLKP